MVRLVGTGTGVRHVQPDLNRLIVVHRVTLATTASTVCGLTTALLHAPSERKSSVSAAHAVAPSVVGVFLLVCSCWCVLCESACIFEEVIINSNRMALNTMETHRWIASMATSALRSTNE